MERAVADMEGVSVRYISLPAALNNMGTMLAELGRVQEAGPAFRRVVDVAAHLYAEDSRKTALITMNYAAMQVAYQRSVKRDAQVVDVRELAAERKGP